MTERMREVLVALRALRETRQYPSTPNEIAITAGYYDGGPRHGGGASARGGWTGHMAPANRVNFAIMALERRGLIRWVPRRDGRSGRAVELTRAGEVGRT